MSLSVVLSVVQYIRDSGGYLSNTLQFSITANPSSRRIIILQYNSQIVENILLKDMACSYVEIIQCLCIQRNGKDVTRNAHNVRI